MKIHNTYANLGKTPDYKVIGNGTPLVEFTVAVNKSRKNDNGEWEKIATMWYNCKAFGEVADRIATELNIGSRILIKEARYETGTYTTQEGEKRYSNDVIIFDYELQVYND